MKYSTQELNAMLTAFPDNHLLAEKIKLLQKSYSQFGVLGKPESFDMSNPAQQIKAMQAKMQVNLNAQIKETVGNWSPAAAVVAAPAVAAVPATASSNIAILRQQIQNSTPSTGGFLAGKLQWLVAALAIVTVANVAASMHYAKVANNAAKAQVALKKQADALKSKNESSEKALTALQERIAKLEATAAKLAIRKLTSVKGKKVMKMSTVAKSAGAPVPTAAAGASKAQSK
jgi:hypothetical protein